MTLISSLNICLYCKAKQAGCGMWMFENQILAIYKAKSCVNAYKSEASEFLPQSISNMFENNEKDNEFLATTSHIYINN